MASKAVEQLLVQGQRSGLFSAAEAQDLLAHLTAEEALTAEQLATKLMERNLLTSYQAERLLAGHGDECLIAGRYRILEKLGEGGMGAVYKAHDTQLDRDVAVKVLPPQSLHDADAVARFQREARALAKLSHPNIIQAYDSGEDKSRHFLVMEYVDGVNLAALLRQQGAIAPTLAADLICQAALGLQHAHEKGLIHRDLKPGNLLAAGLAGPASPTPARESERYRAATVDYPATPAPGACKPGRALVKILDLGLARFLQDQLSDAHLTKEGAGLGTPDYMAPEQFRDALHADARTDIYGLGCTLYHLIAGSVPFPGSSFSEKADAHAKKDPIPLGERCLEMPGGLEYVVSRMMAKHPGERFQTAGEVADALVPYAASGSHSMIRLRETGRWPPGVRTMSLRLRRKRVWFASGLLAAAAVCLCLLVVFRPGWFGLGPAPERLPEPAPAPKPPDDSPIAAKSKPKPQPAKPQVVPIKNGFTVAKDGTGQFTTIGEALNKVDRPGMTILILDDAVYAETLSIRSRRLHEGLTLESRRGATLAFPRDAKAGLLILNVPRVTVRGLVVRANGQAYCIGVGGYSPGVVLQDLRCYGKNAATTTGMILDSLGLSAEDEPAVVRNCTIVGCGNGFEVLGLKLGTKVITSCRRLLIRDNRIEDCNIGMWAVGRINEALIVANRFVDCSEGSIRLNELAEGSGGILVANNSIKASSNCLQITGTIRGTAGVEIRNNVLIAEGGPDMVREGGTPGIPAGWRIDHNMRQVRAPAPDSPEAKRWIPGTKDTVVENLPLLALDPKHADFFRPIKDTPPAKAGAGGDLPTYVGAVPPAGVELWDWQWTWDAIVNKRLTVSKDPKTGGRFRTIAAAFREVKPKMTIRVLDAEKYPEPLVINDAKAHEGIVLEAPKHATLVLGEDSQQALLLRGVANVRVRGFRLQGEGSKVRFPRLITISRGCPGLILEQLHCQAVREEVGGIIVLNATLPPDAEPMIIRKCKIDSFDGVFLSGLANTPLSRVLVVDNRIKARKRGILVDRATHDVLVAGNVVSSGEQAGIQIENPLPAMQRVLVANNTLFNNGSAVRIWCEGDEGKLEKSHVEFRNNILMHSTYTDFVYFHQVPGAPTGNAKDSRKFLDFWRFGQNFRELDEAKEAMLPLAKDDRKLDPFWLVSSMPTDPDFLRPKAGLDLAKGGAGGDLPSYVGALPPEGVQAWNWQKTWNERMRKFRQKE
jgi:serine/threonine protein kinase